MLYAKGSLEDAACIIFCHNVERRKKLEATHNKPGVQTLSAYASVDALPWVSRELAKPSYTEPALPRKNAGCCVVGACVSEIVAQCARSTASVA